MEKVYISADVEGLNGVTSFNQVLPEFYTEYSQMLPQLHLEINALIKGLKKAGVKEIVVNDAHNTMTNLSLAQLPVDVTLISGKPKKVSMMFGLTPDFDAVIFFAYHAKATSAGVLAHTFNMYFKSVYLNNEKVSEAQLNATYAACKNVPIVLASGDDVFCAELKNDIGNICTIQTKQAISSTAAICNKNIELLAEYENIAAAITTYPKILYKTSDEYELKVEFSEKIVAKEIALALGLSSFENFVIYNSSDFEDVYVHLQKISAETTLRRSQNQLV